MSPAVLPALQFHLQVTLRVESFPFIFECEPKTFIKIYMQTEDLFV